MHFCNVNRKFVYSTHLQYVMKSAHDFLKQPHKSDLSVWYLVEELDRVVSGGAGPVLGGDSLDVPIFF